METHQYFASCPKGLENLLLQELDSLGASSTRETVAGVYFSGASELFYRACLWSRLANKILLPLEVVKLNSEADLYEGALSIPWVEHLTTDQCFRVDFLGTDRVIRNTQFGAVRIKDAIVDYFQTQFGHRPSVDKQQPDVVINARLSKGKVHLSLDLSGQSLHRRGYRGPQGKAPIKENLASAILLRAQWPDLLNSGGGFIDPMCGSGTLLIEGTMMAGDMAPGLIRDEQAWGFSRWQQFDPNLWQSLVAEAMERKQTGLQKLHEQGYEARGYDCDWSLVQTAETNIQTAGLSEFIRVLCKPVEELTKPTHKPITTGLVVCNPPYGERLGEQAELSPVYRQLGAVLRREFCGWRAALITSDRELIKHIGINKQKTYQFWNGAIAAELSIYTVAPEHFYRHLDRVSPWENIRTIHYERLSESAKTLCNRLRKNQKKLRQWLEREAVECYRLYDADIPEYAAAIDIYGQSVQVQEYAAPAYIDKDKAKRRFQDVLDACQVALALPQEAIYTKQRRRKKGSQPHEAFKPKDWRQQQEDKKHWRPLAVREGKAVFLVDLWSYLDTGLFLDHRPVRRLIYQQAANRSFLNLFCYTATATVHAALGGAKSSISVDMSNTYLEWARENFAKNHINRDRHQLIQQDCLVWLKNCRQGFDLILLDPPSFSNSKRMQTVLDIQRDHVYLIQRCMELLLPGGRLIFSTNLRSFKLDEQSLAQFNIENITQKTLDPDFQRNSKIHRCWVLRQTVG